MPEISRSIGGSPLKYMAATTKCGSNRRSYWASAAGGCWRHWISIPKYAISTKDMRRFAVLERARSQMELTGLTFEEALAITRAGNIFTSHTAVAAGFDHFDPGLVAWYLGDYATKKLHISVEDLLALGRQYPHEVTEPFNMAYLAIHGSGAVNGVSKLHGSVSRHLFEPLFWRWPTEEVPVGHVTNGVHMPSWESTAADMPVDRGLREGRWLGETEDLNEKMLPVPDDQIWQMRETARALHW